MKSNDTSVNEHTDEILTYKKSSLCSSGTCVEVAIEHNDTVSLRDSKDITQTPLTFSADEWTAFIGGVKNNEFDLAIK